MYLEPGVINDAAGQEIVAWGKTNGGVEAYILFCLVLASRVPYFPEHNKFVELIPPLKTSPYVGQRSFVSVFLL